MVALRARKQAQHVIGYSRNGHSRDAIPFNPNTIVVKQIGQRWKIADGNNWLLDFGPAQGNAKAAFHFIKKCGFTFICFAGRPNPLMTYFRK